jgi:hypothetical protein
MLRADPRERYAPPADILNFAPDPCGHAAPTPAAG